MSESDVLSILADLAENPPDPEKGEITIFDGMRIWKCNQNSAYLRLERLYDRGLFDKRRFGKLGVYAPSASCTPKALREAIAEMQKRIPAPKKG